MNRAISSIFAIAIIFAITSGTSWTAAETKKPSSKVKTEAFEPEKTKAPQAKVRPELAGKEPTAPVNTKALRRLDFRIVGKTCAVCLLGIQSRLRKTPGVAKAAVMLKRPYGACVIYDSTQLDKALILKKAKGDEKEVKLEDPVDATISSLPPVLIPKYNNVTGIDDTQ